MFKSRRRRAASNPPLNVTTASSAATTAATSAFLKNRASNASLSSAAAAAALKARPMSPTSVADVQTKRMLNRTGSTSSMGSSINGSQRSGTPQLERRPSSGSMTERTFRDPSPGRPVPSASDAPPVPAIPQNIHSVAHRRAISLETPPARISSPVSRTPSGRGSSLEPEGTRRAGQRSSLSSVSELTSAEKSRGSVNFSYPTNSRPNSPTSQKRLTSPSPSRHNPRITAPNNQSLIYDPNTRSFLPAVEVHAIQQKISDAANKPIKKKKRGPPGSSTGSHFSDGTVSGRPKGTAVDEMEARAHTTPRPAVRETETQIEQEPPLITGPVSKLPTVPDPAPQPETYLPKKKKKRVVTNDSDSDQGSYLPNSSDNDSDVVTYSPRKGPILGKKPSIVREDREREEEEDDTPKREKPNVLPLVTSQIDRNISPSPLPRSKAGRGHGKDLVAAIPSESREAQRSVSQPTPSMQHIEPVAEPFVAEPPVAEPPVVEPPIAEPNVQVSNGSIRGTRVSSLSPGRNAHFAATPDNLMVKHQPPPRSISPRKSALKHSNSRTSSPMPTQGSETSNSPGGPEEQIVPPRKKSVRVSFDETNVAVGEAATSISTDSPVVQSPQAGKRPWYSIARGKKKDLGSTDDEEDEVMKPRPALPFFGSIRERKNRDVEERVLVKPAEPVETKSVVRSPLSTTHTEDAVESPLGQSNDHAVGAILAQDSTTKNAANISKSREPLPPQVTSVEGSGYSSDSDSSVAGIDNTTPPTVITEPEEAREPIELEETEISAPEADSAPQSSQPISDDSDNTPTPTQEAVVDVIPQIAISSPTPTPEESEKRKGWPDIPGSWESSTSDSDGNETPRVSLEERIAQTPAAAGIAEPTPDLQVHGSPKVEAEHLYNTTVIMEETESEADVFSDAAEELTDSDEEGFQSLNAVVESPITRTITTIPSPPDSPTSRLVKEKAYEKSGLSNKESELDRGEGWDKAQQFWSGLSADKKRQLELDAIRDAEEESDTEVEVKPAPKPKKKKKKVVRPAPSEPVVSSERTYMIQPGSKASHDSYTPMRTSMRTEPLAPVGESSMRKSMRGPGQSSMRESMRGPQKIESRGSVQKKNRPVSLPVEPKPAPIVKHSRNISSTSAPIAPISTSKPQTALIAPTLRRKNSGDSESSFKRTRPERSMMRTMRGGNAPPQQQEASSSRFSIRSLSPTGSVTRRPFSNSSALQSDSSPTHMRMSMRGSSGPTPTMRGPASRPKSPSTSMKMPGFGRSSKPAKPQKSIRTLGSRFADSSDEEEERPAFRSRFVDSSDDSDDEPIQKSSNLGRTMRSTPSAAAPSVSSQNLRGIPKKTGVEDGDSSSLPDSDDEKPSSPSTKLSKKRQTNGAPILNGTTQGLHITSDSLRRSGSGRGTITTISAPPPVGLPSKRRGSIMSILRRKKDDTSKVRKSDAESPARRDTPLERSKSDLLALRTPSSPKLQKRNPLSRENSNVPLSPVVDEPTITTNYDEKPKRVMTGGEDGRPSTADAEGVNGKINGDEKPGLGTRRFTTDGPLNGTSSGVNGVGVEGTKKKKKFASLRRIFKLDD